MSKVSLKSNSVAYFDHPDHVDEPGFYLVEGDETETDVTVYDGGSFATAEGTDDEGNPTTALQLDGRGRPVWAKAPESKNVIQVKHNTNPKVGKRVWPDPDGDGFVTEKPKDSANGGPQDVWNTNGGEG